jgi:aryl-alcohol dehydrogenase-like predicted oxidoreductase
MTEQNIGDVIAAEAEHAEHHRDDAPSTQGYRRTHPPREPAQVYSLRVPADRLEQLRELAADKGVTPSALMRGWVLERLDAARADRRLPQAAFRELSSELEQILAAWIERYIGNEELRNQPPAA